MGPKCPVRGERGCAGAREGPVTCFLLSPPPWQTLSSAFSLASPLSPLLPLKLPKLKVRGDWIYCLAHLDNALLHIGSPQTYVLS